MKQDTTVANHDGR